MTLTTHAAIGAALGSTIGSPLLGFALGLASHFLVDIIPHGDNHLVDKYRKTKKKRSGMAYVTVDASIAILFLMSVVSGRPSDATTNLAFSAAVIGSILPDLLVGLNELFKNRFLQAFHRVHFFFHDCVSRRYGDVKLSYALIAQATFIAVLMHYIIP